MVVAEGFTNIVGLDVDAEGNIWVLEIAAGGLLNVTEDPASMAGGLYKVSPDGAVEEIAIPDLVFPGGIKAGDDGAIYISNYGLMPGMGTVIKVTWE